MLTFNCHKPFITCAYISIISFFLVLDLAIIVLLIPPLVNGPSSLVYMIKSTCQIINISYINNKCQIVNDDVIDLYYKPYWKDCLYANFSIYVENEDINSLCYWIYPKYFDTEKEALVEIGKSFHHDQYECVVDVIDNICYPYKHEEAIFITSFVISLIFTILFVFLYIRHIRKKNKIID